MQRQNIPQKNNSFLFVDAIKEESFDLSEMLTQEESFEENSIKDESDFFVDISYNEPNRKKKKKSKKKIIKRVKKRLKKHFNRFYKRKKLRKNGGNPNENESG